MMPKLPPEIAARVAGIPQGSKSKKWFCVCGMENPDERDECDYCGEPRRA